MSNTPKTIRQIFLASPVSRLGAAAAEMQYGETKGKKNLTRQRSRHQIDKYVYIQRVQGFSAGP